MRMLSVLLFVLSLISTPCFAKTLTLLIDRSQSNPAITSPPFAEAAGKHAGGEVAVLQLGDTVRVRHFGERGEKNVRSETIRLTRQARPQAVAAKIRAHIAGLPAKTQEGDNQTNILAALEFGSFDCAKGERIVLYTDGIEASATMSDRAFLLSGKPLPAPPPEYLKGCEVVMFGLGASRDGSLPPALIKSIRDRWADYFKAAGASFTAIIDP